MSDRRCSARFAERFKRLLVEIAELKARIRVVNRNRQREEYRLMNAPERKKFDAVENALNLRLKHWRGR